MLRGDQLSGLPLASARGAMAAVENSVEGTGVAQNQRNGGGVEG